MNMRELMALVESRQAETIDEGWVGDAGGTRVYQIKSRSDYKKLLTKSGGYLRAFLDAQNEALYAWDGHEAVHPDVRNKLDLFGIPLHLSDHGIEIRSHGLDEYYVWQMYNWVKSDEILHRIYGPKLPPISVDDDENTQQMDGKDFSAHEKRYNDEETVDHWDDHWHSY